MKKELADILSVFNQVIKDLSELEAADDLVYYTCQITGNNSTLNSFTLLVAKIQENDNDKKMLVAEMSKQLSIFMYSYAKRRLSFFYPNPSAETQEEFYNQPIQIINKILQFGLRNGRTPIPDNNPIYNAFGISHQFPELKEDFKNCLLLLYRNIILQNVFIPIHDISLLPIIAKSKNGKYDTEKLFKNIYVIESESGMKQGTAFHIMDIGIITCDHCIRDGNSNEILEDIKIYRGDNFAQKFPCHVTKSNKDIDLALLKIPEELKGEFGLEIGSSVHLEQLQKINVAGFPNYNFGDNGVFSPGIIVGFRTYSGIRHLLVNSPLISGNSGGPVFDENSKVIGIAVTGADKMSKAHETEKHGVIPIEALSEIQNYC
ncbi:serine protease [Belliella sp. DSM 107340]|uniref:Serine protease n=1 Tax=Belliella calami TaxID=2923436 RepID=A0ABS9UJC9_9BACT|nr:serine protease [Belliella calami]MCH7396727.1 serine protease [Belliella calami]